METTVTVTASGSASAATGTGYTECAIRGTLERIYYSYLTCPVTTMIAVTEDGGGNVPILTAGPGNTPGAGMHQYPFANVPGAAPITIYYTPKFFSDNRRIKVVVSGANSGSIVSVTFVFSDMYFE